MALNLRSPGHHESGALPGYCPGRRGCRLRPVRSGPGHQTVRPGLGLTGRRPAPAHRRRHPGGTGAGALPASAAGAVGPMARRASGADRAAGHRLRAGAGGHGPEASTKRSPRSLSGLRSLSSFPASAAAHRVAPVAAPPRHRRWRARVAPTGHGRREAPRPRRPGHAGRYVLGRLHPAQQGDRSTFRLAQRLGLGHGHRWARPGPLGALSAGADRPACRLGPGRGSRRAGISHPLQLVQRPPSGGSPPGPSA